METRKAARAGLIAGIANMEVDSPDSLEQQNEVFRSVLSRTDELSLDSQVLKMDEGSMLFRNIELQAYQEVVFQISILILTSLLWGTRFFQVFLHVCYINMASAEFGAEWKWAFIGLKAYFLLAHFLFKIYHLYCQEMAANKLSRMTAKYGEFKQHMTFEKSKGIGYGKSKYSDDRFS